MDTFRYPYYLESLSYATFFSQYAGAGGWSDMDMLYDSSYTNQQARSQFSLNAILGSPMLLSMNVNSLSPYLLQTYSNQEVLNISGDGLARPGVQVAGGVVANSGGSQTTFGIQLAPCTEAVGGLRFNVTTGVIAASNGKVVDLGPSYGDQTGCFPQVVLNNRRSTECCTGMALPKSSADHRNNISSNSRQDTTAATTAATTATTTTSTTEEGVGYSAGGNPDATVVNVVTCKEDVGVNYNGGDLHSFTSSNTSGCCAACHAMTDCAVWVVCKAGDPSCDDGRCWLKSAAALKHRQWMPDRVAMYLPHPPHPPPPPPPPSPPPSNVCKSQRWMAVPVNSSSSSTSSTKRSGVGSGTGEGLKIVLIASSVAKGWCLAAVPGSSVGLLNVTACNAADPLQQWQLSPDGILARAVAGGTVGSSNASLCMSAQSAAGPQQQSDRTTVWAKTLSDGYAIGFYNQNAEDRNVTCDAHCMAKVTNVPLDAVGSAEGRTALARGATFNVRDVWGHSDWASTVDSSIGFTVLVNGSDATVMLKLTRQ